MNVNTLTMPRSEAKARLKEYRAGLHKRADAEWEQVAAAYEAAAKGLPILFLSQVFAECPRDEKGRPRLAIARADRKQVRYRRGPYESEHVFRTSEFQGASNRGLWIAVPTLSEPPARWASGFALVPMVPPEAKGSHDLSKHFVLWEVEQWAERSLLAKPDLDPYLLRRLSEDAYAVVAEWELTEIERAVMRGRAQ